MQYLSIHHAGHRIEVHNSLFGVESILVDGVEVSSKRSLGGSTHTFSLSTEERRIPCEVKFHMGLNAMGVSVEFLADGKPVVELMPGKYVLKQRDYILLLLAGVVLAVLALLVANLAE